MDIIQILLMCMGLDANTGAMIGSALWVFLTVNYIYCDHLYYIQHHQDLLLQKKRWDRNTQTTGGHEGLYTTALFNWGAHYRPHRRNHQFTCLVRDTLSDIDQRHRVPACYKSNDSIISSRGVFVRSSCRGHYEFYRQSYRGRKDKILIWSGNVG